MILQAYSIPNWKMGDKEVAAGTQRFLFCLFVLASSNKTGFSVLYSLIMRTRLLLIPILIALILASCTTKVSDNRASLMINALSESPAKGRTEMQPDADAGKEGMEKAPVPMEASMADEGDSMAQEASEPMEDAASIAEDVPPASLDAAEDDAVPPEAVAADEDIPPISQEIAISLPEAPSKGAMDAPESVKEAIAADEREASLPGAAIADGNESEAEDKAIPESPVLEESSVSGEEAPSILPASEPERPAFSGDAKPEISGNAPEARNEGAEPALPVFSPEKYSIEAVGSKIGIVRKGQKSAAASDAMAAEAGKQETDAASSGPYAETEEETAAALPSEEEGSIVPGPAAEEPIPAEEAPDYIEAEIAESEAPVAPSDADEKEETIPSDPEEKAEEAVHVIADIPSEPEKHIAPIAIMEEEVPPYLIQLFGILVVLVVLFTASAAIRNAYSMPLSRAFSMTLALTFTLLSCIVSYIVSGWNGLSWLYLLLLLTYPVFRSRNNLQAPRSR